MSNSIIAIKSSCDTTPTPTLHFIQLENVEVDLQLAASLLSDHMPTDAALVGFLDTHMSVGTNLRASSCFQLQVCPWHQSTRLPGPD